jgi:hypothetical protein
MMTPEQFLKTVYLGDRACKGYIVDIWERRFSLVVDSISRIRSPSGIWDFDTSEDISDGCLVFENITSLAFTPSGSIPNDYILGISVEPSQDSYIFQVSVASTSSEDSTSCVVEISLHATGVYLQDPGWPDKKIRE